MNCKLMPEETQRQRFLKQGFSKKFHFLFLPLLVIKYGEEKDKEAGMRKGRERKKRGEMGRREKEGRMEGESKRMKEKEGGWERRGKKGQGERGKINRKSRRKEWNRKESLHC